MQFGILGPLEVTTECGDAVALGGARARAGAGEWQHLGARPSDQ